ncbi:MAG TPA: PEP-CTERM sorting domain-containing protein [Bryobacteraceae bacterium]|jgi:hypothetical protein
MKPLLALAACVITLSLPSFGSASTLYSALPDNDISSPNIFFTWSGSAHFSLAGDSILNSATLALWMNNDVTPSTLDWSIEDSTGANTLFSGASAALTNAGPAPVRGGDFSLYYSTLALPNLNLAAGSYLLHISNCGTNDYDGCGWGLVADQTGGGNDIQFNGETPSTIGTYAFSIQGSAATPEPATWLMFVPGIAGLVAVIRRRR